MWLTREQTTQEQLGARFLELINGTSILKIPGVHDALTGLIAKKVGFGTLYLSGAAYTASKGLPDLGLVYSNEVAEHAQEIIRATKLPLLVDIDTGFGGVLNVARTAKEMVEARVAAVQIEDQRLPKKCGHLNGKQLIEVDEMVQKIKTIKEVAPTLVVVARTDAMAVEGQEKAMERVIRYEEAGADALFPEALITADEFKAFREVVNVPLLANMTEFGRTPYYTADEFQSFGYNMVIYPVSSLRAAAKACERLFEDIFHKGTQMELLEIMQTRKELYETIGYFEYEALDSRIAATRLPDDPKQG